MVFAGKAVCMKCQKNLATVKLTRIVNGEVKVLNLCQTCAADISPYQKKMAEAQMNLSQILASILHTGKEAAEKEQSVETDVKLVCGTCGLPFRKYKKSLFLGCPDCYESFGKHVVADLRKFHGSTLHRGKVPERLRRTVERRRDIEGLRRRMNQAIEHEEFELAARLRDQIRELQERSDSK
jgi:protein arginine kinase activator